MDTSRCYHENNTYELGNGLASLNLYNGRLLYNYPLSSIGNGNYKIGVNLVYNSKYKSTDFFGKLMGLGNGWKLNYQQYLFPYKPVYDIEGFTISDYVYIDASWNIHRFVRYKKSPEYGDGECAYYDDSGTGLKLVIRNNVTPTIYDEQGNMYIFDNEKLTHIVSGVHYAIKKTIKYDNDGSIKKIFDERKPNQIIDFKYQNDEIISIKPSNSNVYYSLEYSDGNLVGIYKNSTDKSKKIHEFKYAKNNQLIDAINLPNMNTLKFKYSDSTNRVIRALTGTLKKEINKSSNSSEQYCNDLAFVENDKYVTNNYHVFNRYNYVLDDEYLKEIDNYDYQEGYTDITNKKGIVVRYYYDLEGRIVSIFEVLENNKLVGFNRQKGFELAGAGSSNIMINGKNAFELSKNSDNRCVYNFGVQNESFLHSFINIVNTDSKKASEHFNLTFWMMFKNDYKSNHLVEFKYSLNGEQKNESVRIESVLTNVWQPVTIYLNLGTNQSSFEPISISFDVVGGVNSEKVLISDVRMNEGGVPEICIDSIDDPNEHKVLKMGTTVYLLEYNNGNFGTSGYKSVALSADFFMSEIDVIATYNSLFYSKHNNKEWFDLFYCNKTKCKSVKYVKLISHNNTEYEFSFMNSDSNHAIPNYHFRLIDLVAFNDESKVWMINEVQRSYGYDRDINKYYYKTKNAVGLVSGMNNGEEHEKDKRLQDDKATISYTTNLVDGTKIESVYVKHFRNEEDDTEQTISLYTKNELDSYGNIKSIKTYNTETGEKLEKSFSYIEDNIYSDSSEAYKALRRENVSSYSECGSLVEYKYSSNNTLSDVLFKYDKKYEIDTSGIELITSFEPILKNKIYYVYDEFEELKRVEFYDSNNNLINKNEIGFDRKDNINLLKDLSEANYGFIYNGLNDLSKVYKNKKLIEEYEDNITENNDVYERYSYKTENNSDVNSKHINKYGQLKFEFSSNNITNNAKSTSFRYEDSSNKYSKSLERVSYISDPYTDTFIDIEYNDESGETKELENYYEEAEKRNIKRIITKANGTKIYDIKNDYYVTKHSVIVEDEMNNNPKSSIVYNVRRRENIDNLRDEVWNMIPNYAYNYEYDKLGRLINKKQIDYVERIDRPWASIKTNKNIEYYTNTSVPKTISYNETALTSDGDTNVKLVYENSYVDGNITKVKETGTRFYKKNTDELGTTSIETKTTKFSYDDLNRIIKEVRPNGDIFDYIYDDKSNMVSTVKKNNNIIKSLSFETGKLTKIENNGIINNIEYDNYGNIIQTNEARITYNSRNLMDSYQILNGNKYLYSYNYQGIRFKKQQVNGETTKYILDGTRILGEDIYNASNQLIEKFRYYYDASGICGIAYVINERYRYYNLIKDSIGNISKIMYEGLYIGEYSYDAWGNCEVSAIWSTDSIDRYILQNNPFRFKGYYYDTETELYYCNSRYYSPELGIWISPDSIEYLDPESINGLNLYCYCGNDPVNNYDPSGHFAISALIIGAIIGAAIGFGTAAYIDYQDDGQIFNGSVAWYDYLGATLLGGVIGAAIGAGIGAFAGMSFSATLPTEFAMIETTIGTTSLVITSTTTLTVTGAQILGTVGMLTLGSVMLYSEHTKGARNSTRGKHEKGQARKARDQRGFIKRTPRKTIRKGKWDFGLLGWLYYEYFLMNKED